MPDRTKALLFERSLACFGIVGRSLSHDIANVLATINESAGLVEDYLAAADDGLPLDPAKLRRVSERIGRQVERGEAYVGQLNRFAHTMDHPRETLDVASMVEAVVGLCERFARLRKVTLEPPVVERTTTIEGSAFELQHAIFRAVELVLLATAPGEAIVATSTVREQDAVVEVAGTAPDEPGADLRAMGRALAALVGVLGGRVEQRLEPGAPPRVALRLPRQLGSLWLEGELPR